MDNTNDMSPLDTAIDCASLGGIADACNVRYQAVQQWREKGLPRTEYSGETNYAENIEKATGGSVKAADLLAWSKSFRQNKASAA